MELIKRGEKSSRVASLQARLEKLGFEIAPSERSGTFGASTEQAVRGLQQRRGLLVDGLVGEATWREIVESSYRLGDRLLMLTHPHLKGDDVRDLQARINALGFMAGKHDGIFGPRTDSALRDFQRNLAIDEDGIAGPETLRALERLRLVTKPGLGARIVERESRRAAPRGIGGKRIALDPGHGGDDPGEVGPSGETEAELVFMLAARTAQLLEARKAETMLTRGPHDGPSESERALLANAFKADLFVSIHLNAHHLEAARGAAAYFFEDASVASEPGEHLAELIMSALVSGGQVDCRAHGKSYPVLRETSMPAVIVEPGFVTNPEDVKLLTEPGSVDSMAEAIAASIDAYYSEVSD